MFLTRTRINIRDWDTFLSDIGSKVASLVNLSLGPNSSLTDQDLKEILPVSDPASARAALQKLSASIPCQRIPDSRTVAHNLEIVMEMKPNSLLGILKKENPIINVYRFLMANRLIDSILRNRNNSNNQGNIDSLRRIAVKIPNEVFNTIGDLFKSNPGEPYIDDLLHALIVNNQKLQQSFISFAIDNFKNAEMQKYFIDHLNRIEISPFAELLRRSIDLDHTKVNSVSHLMSAYLGMPDAASRSLDDIKQFLYEKLLSDKTCLAKSRLLVELLKSSFHDSSVSERILTEIQNRPVLSQNLQICKQLLNMQYEGLGRVTEPINLTLTLHDSPPRIYMKRSKPLKPRIARKPIQPVERKSIAERFALVMKGILLPPNKLESDEDFQPSLA